MKQKIIDHWGSELIESYEKIIKDFGLEVFSENTFPKPNRIMRRNVVFAGRGMEQIAEAIKNKKKFYVLSGIMPTNDKIHFGNKMVIENIKYFQGHGAKTYMLIADLEAASTRGVSLEEARKRAIYGNADPGRIFAAITQVGDVLYPQLEERMPGIIPTGVDQDPHIRLARDIVRRSKEKKFFLISSIYHKYTPS